MQAQHTFSRQQIAAMREWIEDCVDDVPEDVTDREIIRYVQRHYEGGVKAFDFEDGGASAATQTAPEITVTITKGLPALIVVGAGDGYRLAVYCHMQHELHEERVTVHIRSSRLPWSGKVAQAVDEALEAHRSAAERAADVEQFAACSPDPDEGPMPNDDAQLAPSLGQFGGYIEVEDGEPASPFSPSRCQVWKIIETTDDRGVVEIASSMNAMGDREGERIGVRRVLGVWRDKHGQAVPERMRWALDAESERQDERAEYAILTGEIVVNTHPEVDPVDLLRAEDDGMIPRERMAPHPVTEHPRPRLTYRERRERRADEPSQDRQGVAMSTYESNGIAVSLSPGIPTVEIAGAPDAYVTSVREILRERRALPMLRCVVNLSLASYGRALLQPRWVADAIERATAQRLAAAMPDGYTEKAIVR